MAGANEEGKQQRDRKTLSAVQTYLLFCHCQQDCLLTEKHVLCSVSMAACGAPSHPKGLRREFLVACTAHYGWRCIGLIAIQTIPWVKGKQYRKHGLQPEARIQ